jgi:hypothetical protein
MNYAMFLTESYSISVMMKVARVRLTGHIIKTGEVDISKLPCFLNPGVEDEHGDQTYGD